MLLPLKGSKNKVDVSLFWNEEMLEYVKERKIPELKNRKPILTVKVIEIDGKRFYQNTFSIVFGFLKRLNDDSWDYLYQTLKSYIYCFSMNCSRKSVKNVMVSLIMSLQNYLIGRDFFSNKFCFEMVNGEQILSKD